MKTLNKKNKIDIWFLWGVGLALAGVSGYSIHVPLILGPIIIVIGFIAKKKGSPCWGYVIYFGVLAILAHILLLWHFGRLF